MLDDGVLQDGHPVRHDRLLVDLQEGLELGELRPLDEPVQVHLLQDVEAGQALDPLVFIKRGQHPGPLLAGSSQDGADRGVLQSRQSLGLVDLGLVGQLVVSAVS